MAAPPPTSRDAELRTRPSPSREPLASRNRLSYRRDMPQNRLPRRSALLSFQFVGTALVGSLTMALVCAFAPPPAQLAVLGAFISILGGLFVGYMQQERERDERRNE